MRRSASKALRFTKIKLQSWRNFTNVDVDLQRRAFLIGPNASGKSNFLDVFRFLRDIVSVGGGFQEAVRRRGGVSKLRCLAARRSSDIVIQVHIGNGNGEDVPDWEYELSFNQSKQRQTYILRERVAKSGSEILRRPDREDKRDSTRLTQTYLEQVYANQDFRDLADFFRSVRYLHIVPQLIREPDRSIGGNNDPFGGDFLEQIARTTEKTRNARLRRIVNALQVAVPQLEELELQRDIRGTPHLRGKYKNWRYRGTWQMEEQFSDGTLRLMGLLWATLDGNGPLLLEEPELSLHPEVVRYIPQIFARVQRRSGRQILFSTHSSDLLWDEGIGLDEVLLLQPGEQPGAGTSVCAASSIGRIAELLEDGLPLVEVVIPETSPKEAQQLTFWEK
jgi:predicted ATPase